MSNSYYGQQVPNYNFQPSGYGTSSTSIPPAPPPPGFVNPYVQPVNPVNPVNPMNPIQAQPPYQQSYPAQQPSMVIVEEHRRDGVSSQECCLFALCAFCCGMCCCID